MKVRYKKHGTLQFYESECLYTVPREPPPVLTGPFERCEGCPYPGHGFVCCSADGGSCLRTEAARIMEWDKSSDETGLFAQPERIPASNQVKGT